MAPSAGPALGLALGGGGMKGLAHLGVLQVLEEIDLRPDLIAGTSIGAVVGAFVAAGFSVAELAAVLQSQHFLSLLSLPAEAGGLVGTERFRSFLLEHLGNRRIEDLDLAFVATVTDVEAGSVEFLDSGPLVDVVLASASMPGVFAPVFLNDRPYVDGGLVDNLPVDELRRRNARFVVAVRLNALTERWDMDRSLAEGRAAVLEQGDARPTLGDRLARRLAERAPGAAVMLRRALEISQMHHEAATIRLSPPDVLIEPVLDDVGTLDLYLPPGPIVRRGAEAAALKHIELETLREQIVAQ